MPAITIDTAERLMAHGDYLHIHPDGSVDVAPRGGLKQQLEDAVEERDSLRSELAELKALLDTPETEDFDKAVPLEAAHQVKRWGVEGDAGKTPADWFWLVGYLAGKAMTAHITGNREKAKHHCISTAAVLRNWHAHIRTGQTAMRPGVADPAGLSKE
jgi:hypothetical protein